MIWPPLSSLPFLPGFSSGVDTSSWMTFFHFPEWFGPLPTPPSAPDPCAYWFTCSSRSSPALHVSNRIQQKCHFHQKAIFSPPDQHGPLGSSFQVWHSLSSVQFSSVTQSCPTLCDPMNCSMLGLPVHHQLPEFIQTCVH